MGYYMEWTDLMENQTEESFEDFWTEYATTEKNVYEKILEIYPEHLKGKYSDLVKEFGAKPEIFMGFCDGINSSLIKENDLDAIDDDTELDFEIDYEKLFFNMLKADADYLYTLPQWENVLTEDQMIAIVKDFKRSKIVHVEKEPGRNDPCPCGSGKKYKKCCGANK